MFLLILAMDLLLQPLPVTAKNHDRSDMGHIAIAVLGVFVVVGMIVALIYKLCCLILHTCKTQIFPEEDPVPHVQRRV